jgi:hypothetical protein
MAHFISLQQHKSGMEAAPPTLFQFRSISRFAHPKGKLRMKLLFGNSFQFLGFS